MVLSDLKEKISQALIDSHLSIDAIYFVIKDIFKDIEQLYYLELQKENKGENEEVQKESDK